MYYSKLPEEMEFKIRFATTPSEKYCI